MPPPSYSLSTFPESERAGVQSELERYGTEAWHNEVDRVRRDILLLAKGDAEEVRHLVDAAVRDYRDILYWAEYMADDPWYMWTQLFEKMASLGFVAPEARGALEKDGGFDREREALQAGRIAWIKGSQGHVGGSDIRVGGRPLDEARRGIDRHADRAIQQFVPRRIAFWISGRDGVLV